MDTSAKLLALIPLLCAATAQADLARVGPSNTPAPPGHGFPLWYQDLNGLVLDICLPGANDKCLKIVFTNLLAETRPTAEAPATRTASAHVMGLQPMDIGSDGSFVGTNSNSLAGSNQTRTYTYFAEREGAYFMYSTAPGTAARSRPGCSAPSTWSPRGPSPTEAR
jgi:hypothetical protein